MEVFENILQNFEQKNILVVGDLILEELIVGTMTGISQNGPIPVVEKDQRNYFPGAAGHVAALLQALGCKAHIVGFVGHDSSGKILIDELVKCNINIDGIFIHKELSTNAQTRVSVTSKHQANQEILIINSTDSQSISPDSQKQLLNVIEKKIDEIDAILVIDKYAALITREFVGALFQLAKKHEKLLIGDSDKNRGVFKNFDIVICNDKEVSESTGVAISDTKSVEQAGDKLLSDLALKYLLITRGRLGISVLQKDKPAVHLGTEAQQVFDVTGAGETVTAALAASMVNGADIIQASRLANNAAGIGVSKAGFALVSKAELLMQFRKDSALNDAEKIVNRNELKDLVIKAKKSGRTVVWTNGCFDLMHVGHILYLQHARSQGDLLVVGLNSDASVRESKGSARPIVEETQRAKLLSSLTCVDYVIIFSDKTPLKLLDLFKPDVYVKGGDYTIDTINQEERRLVEGYGGKIALMPGVDGMSTTNIIDKILKISG